MNQNNIQTIRIGKAIFTIVVFFLVYSFSIQKINAQCGCAAANYGTVDVNAWTVGQSQSITPCIWGGERATIYNTVAGAVYRISTCGASYDTQLSIYTTACAYVGYNDDNGPACGGTAASIDITSPGGDLYAVVHRWNCQSENTCAPISIQLISLPSLSTCQGNCGGNGGGCWCDNYCFVFMDCCPDMCTYCPPGPAEIDAMLSTPICTSSEITIQFSSDVSCTGTDASSFILTGPNGQHNISNVYSTWCVAQGTAVGSYFDNIWTLELDDYLNYDGEYTLTLVNNTVVNACGVWNNFHEFTFTITGMSAYINVVNDNICYEDQSGALAAVITDGLTGGPYTYEWEGNNYSSSGSPNISNLHPGNYDLSITNAAGCVWTGNETVVGAPEIIISANSNSPICEGETLTLTSSSPQAVSYEWSGPIAWNSNSQNPSRPNVTTSMTGNYSVVATDQWGCTNSIIESVSIMPEPTVSCPSNITGVCIDDPTFALSGASPSGGTYTGAGFFSRSRITYNNLYLYRWQ